MLNDARHDGCRNRKWKKSKGLNRGDVLAKNERVWF